MELDSCSSVMFPPVILSKETPISSAPKLQQNKKKRNLPGNPDPEAEVIALSPRTLLATNRFVCEVCNKGFQRDQNLQLHRRGHNLPWKLKQKSSKDNKKRAYVCPETTCVHHHPCRALGDLTGIKKHFSRKHGEKKWKCDKCSKVYAVQSDWKAHSKICGTREYRCDCGTLFTRKDSFITHRSFCDALAEESARLSGIMPENGNFISGGGGGINGQSFHFMPQSLSQPFCWPSPQIQIKNEDFNALYQDPMTRTLQPVAVPLSATALLQKATTVGPASVHVGSTMADLHMYGWNIRNGFTRDFLGLAAEQYEGSRNPATGDGNVREVMSFNGGAVGFPSYSRDNENYTQTWGNC